MIIGPSEGINRLEELDVNVSRVVVTEILLDEADQVGIVGPVGVLVQPERDLGSSGPGAGHNELDPVLDGDVLDLTHPPDVASLHSVLVDLVAGSIGDSDGTLRGDLKSLKVYGCVVKLTFLLVVLIGVVNIIVGPVGDETLDLLELLILVPHLNTVDVEHEGVNVDIAGNVEVCGAIVKVNYGKSGPGLVLLHNVSLNFLLHGVSLNFVIDTNAVVCIDLELIEEG